MPDVLVVMGSESDKEVAGRAEAILQKYGISHETVVASAHRDPEKVMALARREDVKVFIAIAGLSAALPGVVASHTKRPVIGVPVSGKLNLDAILSIVQMPKGVPVGAVGLDRGDNAAILAARILAISDPSLAAKLRE